MRSIWLLPDREQSGSVKAVEGEDISLLHRSIDLKELPSAFILGIPEEIYRSKSNRLFLFGQFAVLNSGKCAFCLSAPAGKDSSGRLVSISNLQIINPDESPNLNPYIPKNVSSEDKEFMDIIVDLCKNGSPEIVEPIIKMLDSAKHRESNRTFSSEVLHAARNKPDWMPVKKNQNYSFIKIEIYPQIRSA